MVEVARAFVRDVEGAQIERHLRVGASAFVPQTVFPLRATFLGCMYHSRVNGVGTVGRCDTCTFRRASVAVSVPLQSSCLGFDQHLVSV